MIDVEKYMQHLPDCDCLQNTICKVPCSCGRDAAVAELRQTLTEAALVRQVFAKLNLTILHFGPMT